MNDNKTLTSLKRELSLAAVTFYGIGTIIGAGIYVLVGKVAAASGVLLPFAFLLAGTIAAFTAFSYAELSSRFPQSAGSAIYIYQAWKQVRLSQLVGILVILTGIVSAATISRGFVGYLNLFVDLSPTVSILMLIGTLTLIALWGIKESAAVITLITLLEIGGLIYVLIASSSMPNILAWSDIRQPFIEDTGLLAIIAGSFLAFYAFIGFEDMVNVAEETKNPTKNMPFAIAIAICVSTLLYVGVALLAIRSLPVATLSNSKAPLADLVASAGYSAHFIGAISLVAVVR